MPSPNLNQTQQLFWKLVTAPEGVAAGLTQLSPAERGVAEALARDDARLSGVERLDVYADMYFYRIRDCLKDDFAAVYTVIGEVNFHNLITDYLLAHPPSHFSLRYAGQHLQTFLVGHALSERWPYLADLASVEWAVLEAFDAPDATPMAPTDLASVSQERWPELRFQLTPSLQRLQLRWSVHEVWEATQRGEPAAEPARADTAVRVWRQELRVFHRVMDQGESTALAAVASGAPFAEVCEAIALEDAAATAERAFGLIGSWLADGLLVGLTVSR